MIFLCRLAYSQSTPTLGNLPDRGPTLPATCQIGQIYFKTSATTGLNQCTALNTWTVVPLTGGSGNLPSGTGVVRVDTSVGSASEFSGDITTSGSNAATIAALAVSTGKIAANAVTSAKTAVVNTYRQCDIAVGDTSGAALSDAQLGPQKHVCKIPAASTVVEINVDADAGSPSVIVGRGRCTTFTTGTCSAETIVNLVSGALAVSAGFEKCSNTGGTTGLDGGTTCSATLQNTSLSAGDWLQLVSGTAGGTAKFFIAHVVYTVN